MSNLIYKLLLKVPVALRFLVWVVIAFLSVLSFISLNSVLASHTGNGIFWVFGVLFGIVAVDIFVIAASDNKDTPK